MCVMILYKKNAFHSLGWIPEQPAGSISMPSGLAAPQEDEKKGEENCRSSD
jgi:hypothetical protein